MESEPIDYLLLPLDDLQDLHRILLKRHQDLQQISEEYAQRIHELKRSLDTANAAEAYLSQELEALSHSATQTAADKQVHTELEELKNTHSNLKAEHVVLQQEHESLMEENVELCKKLKVAETQQQRAALEVQPSSLLEEQVERLNALELENIELLQKIDGYSENEVRSTMAAAEREKNIEILRDQVNCLEENLRSKRDELEENTQLLESAQEQLTDANAKLAMLMTAPENNERKGNSLFAEVDDQRQAMKQLLAAQKKSYMQMKKIFNESQQEIRQLKRENIAMHTELQTCSTIFCNADKTYQDKLNERIRQLHNQNEDMERKLRWTQERLKELADGKGVLWLDSMFNFCKQETQDLKQQLHSVRIQKASMEEQLRNAKQEMVRWRYEALKCRCILVDRENLLSENNISFKPIRALEFNITEEQLKAARPRIQNAPSTQQDVKLVTQTTEQEHNEKTQTTQQDIKVVAEMTVQMEEIPTGQKNKKIVAEMNVQVEKTPTVEEVEMTAQVEKPPTVQQDIQVVAEMSEQQKETVSPPPLLVVKPKLTSELNDKENRLQLHSANKLDTDAKLFKSPTPKKGHDEAKSLIHKMKPFGVQAPSKMSPPPVGTLPGRSILCKQRDIFAKEIKSSVKFSANEPTVHNLSAGIELEDVKQKGEGVVQKIHTKSNIVVRRVVLGAKPANS